MRSISWAFFLFIELSVALEAMVPLNLKRQNIVKSLVDPGSDAGPLCMILVLHGAELE